MELLEIFVHFNLSKPQFKSYPYGQVFLTLRSLCISPLPFKSSTMMLQPPEVICFVAPLSSIAEIMHGLKNTWRTLDPAIGLFILL